LMVLSFPGGVVFWPAAFIKGTESDLK
jgi:hypothetical protein